LTGVGVFAFPVAEGTISPLATRQELGIGLKWSAAHNSFVQIGAELGVFGLIAFILAISHTYRTSRKVGRSPPGGGKPSDEQVFGQALAGAVIAYVIAGFFLSQAYGAFVFVLYGLAIGLSKVAGSERLPSLAKTTVHAARESRWAPRLPT
jgi:hypothetical protein